MKRRLAFSLAIATAAFSQSAIAGSLTVTDGRGSWGSTQCRQPAAVNMPPVDAEIAADDLNLLRSRQNQFVAEAQAFMDCVSREAVRDAETASAVVSNSAQAIVNDMQNKVESAAARLRNPRVKN